MAVGGGDLAGKAGQALVQDPEGFLHVDIGVTFQSLGICHDNTMLAARQKPNPASWLSKTVEGASWRPLSGDELCAAKGRETARIYT
jgi:hypothetical protein